MGSYGQADITSYGYLPRLVGALPSGLSFGAVAPIDATHAVGRFSGTPAAGTGGVYHVTVSSSNAIAPDATHDVDITVNEAPQITSVSYAEVTDSQPCTIALSASGYAAAASVHPACRVGWASRTTATARLSSPVLRVGWASTASTSALTTA